MATAPLAHRPLETSLWRFQQRLNALRPGSSMPVPFNRLLHDPAYRERMITEGLAHERYDVRECARQVRHLLDSGYYIAIPTSGDQQGRLHRSQHGWRAELAFSATALLICLIAGAWALTQSPEHAGAALTLGPGTSARLNA